MTDFASAYLMEPAIQVLFNDSTIPIWQVPNDVYSMCMVSDAELQQHVRPYGAIGTFLYDTLYDFFAKLHNNYGQPR